MGRYLPVAVVVEAAGLLEDAGELHAAGTHVFDVGLRAGAAVFEGSLFLGFAPEDFVISIAVNVEWEPDRCRSDQCRHRAAHSTLRLGELFEIVAARLTSEVRNRRRGCRAGRRACRLWAGWESVCWEAPFWPCMQHNWLSSLGQCSEVISKGCGVPVKDVRDRVSASRTYGEMKRRRGVGKSSQVMNTSTAAYRHERYGFSTLRTACSTRRHSAPSSSLKNASDA